MYEKRTMLPKFPKIPTKRSNKTEIPAEEIFQNFGLPGKVLVFSENSGKFWGMVLWLGKGWTTLNSPYRDP